MTESGPIPVQPEPRRACEECNRKKTKCDMNRPVCGLCLRTGNTCHFPSRRKKPTPRKPQNKINSQKISESLSKLVQILEDAAAVNEELGDQGGQKHGSQAALKDSLRDLLAELKDADDLKLNHSHHRMSESKDSNASLSETDDEEDDFEAPDLGEVDGPDYGSRQPTAPSTIGLKDQMPSGLALELIDLFFTKIQPWLPLLHRPRFQAEYAEKINSGANLPNDSDADEALLLYSMFSLSAMFSDHPALKDIAPNKRGHEFAERARDLYRRARSSSTPSLKYLQGCILLAFYFYTCGPTAQGWVLIGICVRVAYEMTLSELDNEDWIPPMPIDAVQKEELRRAWWSVWELDTFASTISRKPYTIDRRRMEVLLPISDDAWFAEIFQPSAELLPSPGKIWRSLQGSANQDERAWFLVSNHLMSVVHDRLQQKEEVTFEEKVTFENELSCFKLSLPPSFRLDAENLVFSPDTFRRCNWIIGTHLMIMATSFMVTGMMTVDGDECNGGSPGASPVLLLRQRAIELSRIIAAWDTRYIVVSHPFFTCMMLPPYAVDGDILKTQPLIASCHDLGKLVLSQYAQRWKLGSVVSELAKMLERPGTLDSREKQLARRYAVFFRIPRLKTLNSPSSIFGEVQGADKSRACSVQGPPSSDITETQQVPHSQADHGPHLTVPTSSDAGAYQMDSFDPQDFAALESSMFDGGDLFEFSDFFYGYGPNQLLPS